MEMRSSHSCWLFGMDNSSPETAENTGKIEKENIRKLLKLLGAIVAREYKKWSDQTNVYQT